jgi:hypothetical protein
MTSRSVLDESGTKLALKVIDMKFAIRLALTISAFAILHTQLASAGTRIRYLQFPAGTPQASTLNLPLTLNLPCYGRVLVEIIPNPPTNAPGGVTFFHQNAAENESPQNNPLISWGSDTDRFNVFISGATSDYRITFTFLGVAPDASRLFLVVAGLAVGTTATVATSPTSSAGSLAGEYTIAGLTSTSKTDLTGSTLSSHGDGDQVNTGWALYQTPPAAVFSSLSVDMHQVSGDGVGWTLAYACCVTPPSGMVAWWPFDETGGTVVQDIAGANDGTPKTGPIGSGGPMPTPGSGKVAGALDFNGASDFVQVPNAPNLNFGTGGLSIDAWVRIPAQFTGLMPIVDKEIAGPTDATYGYAFYVKDGYLGFSMNNDINANPTASIGTDDITKNLANNLWHHVAVVVRRNPASVTGGNLFIDGAPVATFNTVPFAGLTADNTGDLILGSTNRLSRLPVSAFFKGSIDEVEVFNRALDPQDIFAIFSAGSAGKCKPTCVLPPSGMVAWWPLDEPNGSPVVNDIAGVNNQGIPKPGGLLGIPNGPLAVAGHVGGALYFVGNYIDVPPAGLNLANSNLTIDAWFADGPPGSTNFGGLPEWIPGHTKYYAIVDKLGTSPGSGYAFFVRSQATALPSNPVPGDPVTVTVDLAFALGNSIYTAQIYLGTTTFPPPSQQYPPFTQLWPYTGQWIHVAVTVDRNTNIGKFYLNGSPVGATFTPIAGTNNTAPLWIGNTLLSVNGVEYSLDEIEIFDEALMPLDIWDIFDAGSAGKCRTSRFARPPVRHLPFR